ncbi:MAG: type IX secretion system protein PorQ [Cryomorphaceae bacterium]|nr:type IX secretion system protein PorQ [Cryomorphaceae bacterium]
MKNFIRLTFGLIFIFLSDGARGQVGGRSIYNFLTVTPEARPASMAGRNHAHSEGGLEFAVYNPALIREEMHGQLSLNAVSHPGGMFFGSTRYAHHFEKAGTFTAGFLVANYGTFDGRDPFGNHTGNFSATDLAFQMGYAYTINENWTLGSNVKLINSAFETYSSFGMATDLAVLYSLPEKRLDIALLAQNLGLELNSYSGDRGSLPFDLSLSISNRFEHMPLRWFVTIDQLHRPDVSFVNPANSTRDPSTNQIVDEDISILNRVARHVAFGGEFAPSKGFHFSIAYDLRRANEMRTAAFRSSAGLSLGVGFKVKKVKFQYARNVMHISGASNLFSLNLLLNQKDN